MLIGVPAETAAGETRVAVTPETVKKLKAQGHEVCVQTGAGLAASVTDEAYVAAGATLTACVTKPLCLARPLRRFSASSSRILASMFALVPCKM